MAKIILVANWKNHPTSLFEAKSLLKELGKAKDTYKKLRLFIAPPLPYVEEVRLRSKSFSNLASQDFPLVTSGSRTGLVTPDILKSFGIKAAIIGHSELRVLGETNKMVALKLKTALTSGISPFICVGEKSRDQDGEHFNFLRHELKLSLSTLSRRSDLSKLAIVYEPVWAIGKKAKDAAGPEELTQTIIFIRKVLADIFGREKALKIPILYGGSVEPTNAKALLAKTGVRGFLVGHVSLDVSAFKEIARSLVI